MYQLFRSLAYIHSLGICHRDIKPQNLLLDPESAILKLCDFGRFAYFWNLPHLSKQKKGSWSKSENLWSFFFNLEIFKSWHFFANLKIQFFCSAKQLIRGELNVSYICSRYYRAPELIFGATDYTVNIGECLFQFFLHKISAFCFWSIWIIFAFLEALLA